MQEIIWLVAHYPDHVEMDERIRVAIELQQKTNLPIWVFASSTTMYPRRVELMIQDKLLAAKVPESKIALSKNFGTYESYDTVEEYENVVQAAKENGISRIYCVSNHLQLLQLKGLSRKSPVALEFIPSRLLERRWWYLGTRLALIPLAFAGVGKGFLPLRFLRHARSRWTGWNI